MERTVETSEPIEVSELRPYYSVTINATDDTKYWFNPNYLEDGYIVGSLSHFGEKKPLPMLGREGRQKINSYTSARIHAQAQIAPGSTISFIIDATEGEQETLGIEVEKAKRHLNRVPYDVAHKIAQGSEQTGQENTVAIVVIAGEHSNDLVTVAMNSKRSNPTRQQVARALISAALQYLEDPQDNHESEI